MRSDSKLDNVKGREMLVNLYKNTKNPDERYEILLSLAMAEYKVGFIKKVGELELARSRCVELLNFKPSKQVEELLERIENDVKRDGFVGAAIVGGVVGLIGVLAAVLTRRK